MITNSRSSSSRKFLEPLALRMRESLRYHGNYPIIWSSSFFFFYSYLVRCPTSNIQAQLADEGTAYWQSPIASLAAHTTLKTYKSMEISIERLPQHWCPSEGSNPEPFVHENDALSTRPQQTIHQLVKLFYEVLY